MIIRDITEDDIPILIKWLKGFNERTDYPGKRPIDDESAAGFISSFINSQSHAALIAERNGKPIATLGFTILPHPWTGVAVLFKAFWYCEPSTPGAGIKLMRYVERLCREAGVTQLIVSSMTEQVNGMLEREGYKPCEMNYVKDLEI